jgi:BirA family biotin operon repressor/biotin-[acetyl-CoA-carboxylase] ligase
LISWRLQDFAELTSTSDYCISRAKAGEPEGLAVFAAQQSAGRGSRGRKWLSPPGNVALSVLLRPHFSPVESSMFALLAGVAVAQAAKALLPSGPKPMLKWPNDVLLDGQKCAGLLIDAAQAQNRIDWLVIGIGINVAYAPDLPDRTTTCLADEGAETTAIAVAHAVLGKLSSWLEIFNKFGSARIVPAWLSLAHPIGTNIEVKSPHHSAKGTFAGLSSAGELLLRVEDRIEKFSTGEILLASRN